MAAAPSFSSSFLNWPPGGIVSPPPKVYHPRLTTTAIRIPADGSQIHLTTLKLVEADSNSHCNPPDSIQSHNSNGGEIQVPKSHTSASLNPLTENTKVDLDELYNSQRLVYQRAGLPRKPTRLEFLVFNPYFRSQAPGFHVPFAGISETPFPNFSHASLRFQPDVVTEFWKSGEAWKYRAFKRLVFNPREGENLDMMMGEYHIMYTLALTPGLRANYWSNFRILGDAFVLKMASEKNEDGDWYYEDVPQEILSCSLGPQCMETLRSIRTYNLYTMVGERGDQPPGKISFGTGKRDIAVLLPELVRLLHGLMNFLQPKPRQLPARRSTPGSHYKEFNHKFFPTSISQIGGETRMTGVQEWVRDTVGRRSWPDVF